MSGPSFHGISMFGANKKKTAPVSSSSFSSPQDPTIRKGFEAAKRAVEQDEKGHAGKAFPLYQEAVALLLDAVRQGKGDSEQIKRAANTYLTRAEELSQVLDRKKQEAEEAAASKRRSGSLFASRRASAPPAAAGVGAAAHRPSQPDDYDYTGGRAARGRGGAAGAGTAGGRGVVGRGGATTAATVGGKAANGGGRGGGRANEQEIIVMEEMLDRSPGVTWDQIAGLEEAKRTLQEAVVLPNLRPDLFKGLRAPPRGVLLFGYVKGRKEGTEGGRVLLGVGLVRKSCAYEQILSFNLFYLLYIYFFPLQHTHTVLPVRARPS